MSISRSEFGRIVAVALVVAAAGVGTQSAEAGSFSRSHQASGPNGGSVARSRVVQGDGTGNRSALRNRSWTTPAGGSGARSASNVRNADGSLGHDSSIAASNARGSVSSSGGFDRSADGTLTQSRNTTVTNANTGNSMQSSSSYSADAGRSRTVSCYDAGGNAISCPAR